MPFRYIVTGEFKYVTENEDGSLSMHDGHFLNGTIFEDNNLEESEEEGLFYLHDKLVQLVYLDGINNFQPRELTPFTPSPMVSADGIPLFSNKASFCFNIFNEPGNGSEFDDKFVFGGEDFCQGISFEVIQEDNEVYIKSLITGDERYLCVDIVDGKHTICFTEGKPVDNNIKLIPGKHKGMFYIHDGTAYYKVDFYKASYGEFVRANSKDEATLLQFISF